MKKLLQSLCLLFSVFSYSQEVTIIRNEKADKRKCATYEVMENFRRKHPGAESDQQFESWLSQKKRLRTMNSFATVTLPVVFHIVYSDAGDNVSQAAVQQQLLQLNKDFGNHSNSPYSVAANTEIRFALAKTDPSGVELPEPGINRILYSDKEFEAPPYTVGLGGGSDYLNSVIKPATIWDPSKYINIWVLQLEGSVLGVATFPASSGLSGLNNMESDTTAGVAVVPESLGSLFGPNGCGRYGRGRTLTHEFGHFFGLRHIWGDASCGTDYCADTPVHAEENSGVPVHPKANSCGTADEMFENYMDYSDDVVFNTFTADQVARMQTVLTNSPRRNTLASSPVEGVEVTGSNRLAFTDCSGVLTVTESGAEGSPRYRDYTFILNVEDQATGEATVTIHGGGTAVNGFHYQLVTPSLQYASGDQFKPVTIRVFENAEAEENKTITLTFSVSGTGVTAGSSAQSMAITILDDDAVTVANQPVSLLSQDWEAGSAGWSSLRSSTSYPNQFVVSANGDAGGPGKAAHITNNTTTLVNEYTNTEAGLAVFRSPLINASGLRGLQLKFKYKVWGEMIEESAYDYGTIVYASPSAPSSFIQIGAEDAGPYAGTTDTTSGNPTIALPDELFANSSFHLGLYWQNDDSEGNNPGLNIDDITLTGTGTPVETAAGSSLAYDVQPGSGINNFRSTSDRMIARLTNASMQLPGVTAAVTASGDGQAAITTGSGSYMRTEKVFQITTSTPVPGAAYRVTLYFTPAELAVWGSNKLNLKVLKVKSGISLGDAISSSDAVVVTPQSATENTTTGIIAYTADFTDGFSQYMLVSPGFTLPVSLLTFEAKPEKKQVLLSWKTASEQNNKGYAVERSLNGPHFHIIGWVNGAGTTLSATSYQFTDYLVQPNTTYHYRLKQVDRDNRSRYSVVRQARIAAGGLTVSVSPNPATGVMRLFVDDTSTPVTASLVNSKGQTVARWRNIVMNNGYEVNISRFSKGSYTVVVHLPGGNITTPVLIQ